MLSTISWYRVICWGLSLNCIDMTTTVSHEQYQVPKRDIQPETRAFFINLFRCFLLHRNRFRSANKMVKSCETTPKSGTKSMWICESLDEAVLNVRDGAVQWLLFVDTHQKYRFTCHFSFRIKYTAFVIAAIPKWQKQCSQYCDEVEILLNGVRHCRKDARKRSQSGDLNLQLCSSTSYWWEIAKK